MALATMQLELRSDGIYRKCHFCDEYLPVDPRALEFTVLHECHWMRRMRKEEAGKLALKALRQVEWTNAVDGGSVCPWCGGRKTDGHAPGCIRQEALGGGR